MQVVKIKRKKVIIPKDCKYVTSEAKSYGPWVKLAEVQVPYRNSIAATRKCTVQRARREGRWIDCDIRPSRLVSGIYGWTNN